jgi:hypothetical protein
MRPEDVFHDRLVKNQPAARRKETLMRLAFLIMALTLLTLHSTALADVQGYYHVHAETAQLNIWLDYMPVNLKTNYILKIHLESKGDANLTCLRLLKDFQFTLRSQGKVVESSPNAMLSSHGYISRDEHGLVQGDTSRCDQNGKSQGGLGLALRDLYPHLSPGKYDLDVFFAPTGRGLTPVRLPTVPIAIAP